MAHMNKVNNSIRGTAAVFAVCDESIDHSNSAPMRPDHDDEHESYSYSIINKSINHSINSSLEL